MNPKQQKGHWTFFCINTFFIDQYSQIYPYFRIMCPRQVDRLKNKRIYKSNRYVHLLLLRSRGRFSSRGDGEVILARRLTVQPLLVSARIVCGVIINV